MVIECLTDISLLTNLQAPTNCGKDHWSKSIPDLWARWRLPGAFTLPQMKRPSIAGHPTQWPFGQDAHQPDDGYGPAASPNENGGRLFCAAFRPGQATRPLLAKAPAHQGSNDGPRADAGWRAAVTIYLAKLT